jgi:hypothetical protein
MKFALQDFYKIIFYRIESYESNGLRRNFFIGSRSYINLLQILWIKGALGAHLAPNLCTLVIKGCCCCKLHAGFPIFCLLLKQNPNRLKSRDGSSYIDGKHLPQQFHVQVPISCRLIGAESFTIGFELLKPLSLHHLTSDFAPAKNQLLASTTLIKVWNGTKS